MIEDQIDQMMDFLRSIDITL